METRAPTIPHSIVNHTRLAAVFTVMAAAPFGATATAQASNPAPFTQTQADAGRRNYMINCASCHGDDLSGKGAPALVGREFATSTIGQLTAAQLYTYIHDSMPYGASASLASDTYVSILAFILEANSAKPGDVPLTPTSSVKVGDIITGDIPTGFLKSPEPK